MILQRDPRLLPEIREQGCYFMSILFFINKFTNTQWTGNKINQFYRTMVHIGAIMADADFTTVSDDDSTIIDPDKIFLMKGCNVRYNNRHDPPDYVCNDNEFEILKLVYQGKAHFVCGDGKGNVTYDPWGESETAKKGYLHSKRIFRRI